MPNRGYRGEQEVETQLDWEAESWEEALDRYHRPRFGTHCLVLSNEWPGVHLRPCRTLNEWTNYIVPQTSVRLRGIRNACPMDNMSYLRGSF